MTSGIWDEINKRTEEINGAQFGFSARKISFSSRRRRQIFIKFPRSSFFALNLLPLYFGFQSKLLHMRERGEDSKFMKLSLIHARKFRVNFNAILSSANRSENDEYIFTA